MTHTLNLWKKNYPEQGNNLSVIRWIHFLVFCILFAWSLHQICRIFLGIQCYFSHHLLGKINMAFFCKSDQVNKYITEFLGEMMLIFQRPIWKSNHKQFTEMLIKIHPLGWTVVSFFRIILMLVHLHDHLLGSLFTSTLRGATRVECFAQKLNIMSSPVLLFWPLHLVFKWTKK